MVTAIYRTHGRVSRSSQYCMKNLQTGIHCPRGGWQQNQATSRPDCLWPEDSSSMSNAAQLEEKQHWAVERPKLDNAWKLRAFIFIDLDDLEFKDTRKKRVRKNLELSMKSAVLCKVLHLGHGKPVAKTNPTLADQNTHASSKLTNQRENALERRNNALLGRVSIRWVMNIAGKGENSLQHCNLVHKIYPHASSNENPGCESRGWQRVGKARNIAGIEHDESQEQKRCHPRGTRGVGAEVPKNTKDELYSEVTVWKTDDSGSDAVFTEQSSSASQMTAAKVMDVMTRPPGCAVQAAHAVSAHVPSQNGRRSSIAETWSQSRHLETSTTTQVAQILVQYWRSSCSSWAESVRSSFGRTIVGKAIWESPFEKWLGENSKLGMSLCSSWKRIILICVCGWHKIGWKETKSWSDVESTQ